MAKRSIWKGPFIHKEIFSDISLNKKKIKTTKEYGNFTVFDWQNLICIQREGFYSNYYN